MASPCKSRLPPVPALTTAPEATTRLGADRSTFAWPPLPLTLPATVTEAVKSLKVVVGAADSETVGALTLPVELTSRVSPLRLTLPVPPLPLTLPSTVNMPGTPWWSVAVAVTSGAVTTPVELTSSVSPDRLTLPVAPVPVSLPASFNVSGLSSPPSAVTLTLGALTEPALPTVTVRYDSRLADTLPTTGAVTSSVDGWPVPACRSTTVPPMAPLMVMSPALAMLTALPMTA